MVRLGSSRPLHSLPARRNAASHDVCSPLAVSCPRAVLCTLLLITGSNLMGHRRKSIRRRRSSRWLAFSLTCARHGRYRRAKSVRWCHVTTSRNAASVRKWWWCPWVTSSWGRRTRRRALRQTRDLSAKWASRRPLRWDGLPSRSTSGMLAWPPAAVRIICPPIAAGAAAAGP
jgi:hypothetical protein